MATSVGMKAKKKQPAFPKNVTLADPKISDHKLEVAILELEDACIAVLDTPLAAMHDDAEGLYLGQLLVNIANPVSIALRESIGPRHFHYHYRHREEDASILHPVLENPIDMLAEVCATALKQCQSHLVGIADRDIARLGTMLEHALQHFLASYKQHKPLAG